MTTAIVLSGGGARGDFELGALKFLYERGVRPDIICGCSVGALNGIKLAEGEGAPDQGLQGLEAIWLGLQRNEDMYQEQPWLSRIHPKLKDWLTGKGAPPGGPPTRNNEGWGDLRLIFDTMDAAHALAWLLGLDESGGGKEILKMLGELSTARSIYHLEPIRAKLGEHLSKSRISEWRQSGRKLRLGVVSLETGKLRYVTEDGTVLERDNATPVSSGQALSPKCQQLANQLTALQAEKLAAQKELQAATSPRDKALAAALVRSLIGQIGQKTVELHRCNKENPPTFFPLKVDLVDAVMASAIMPGIFPPEKLGSEWYVDGGVREILPVQAAIDLGADTIYAIVASKAGTDPQAPFNYSSLFEILARSLIDIAVDEVQFNETNPASGWGSRTVKIIQPTVDLHAVTVIDPGLISITMAYGYMCAADVVVGAGANTQRVSELAEAISKLRVQTWRLECQFHGQSIPTEPGVPTHPADPALLAEIRAQKEKLQALVDERKLGGLLPGEADTWSRNWERHPWPTASLLPATVLVNGYSWEGGQSKQIVFTTEDGHIHELYVTLNGAWKHEDLTTLASAPPARTVVNGYSWEGGQSKQIIFITENGHIHELHVTLNGTWKHEDLTTLASAPPASAVINGYSWESGQLKQIGFTTEDGSIHELYVSLGGVWKHEDLTALAGAPPARTVVNGYSWEGGQSKQVVFITEDGNIHELYVTLNGTWKHEDLTALTSAPPARTVINGYSWEGGQSKQVVFITEDGNIHELYVTLNGTWKHEDLTALTSAPPARTVINGYSWEGGQSKQIVFTTEDGKIHELYVTLNGTWKHADLPA